MKKEFYPSINGLRAISILFVVNYHCFSQNNLLDDYLKISWLKPFIKFVTNGNLGVNVFFIISGFLITSLLLQEKNNFKKISLKNFYIRRTLRIFPAYYFYLLVCFVLTFFNIISISNDSWLTALTYTKYFNWQEDWETSHAWSLSVEEHFYLLWPICFIGGLKFRKIAAFSLILLVPLLRVYDHLYPVDWMNELTIFKRIDSIALGCVFAIYKDRILTILQPHFKKIFYLSLLAIISLKYWPFLAKKISLSFIFIPLGYTHGTIANILVAIIMMYSIYGSRGLWFKFLNSKVVNYIGLLSYSIYLWQQLFSNGSKHWVSQFPQNIVMIIGAALFSYYLIEKPFLKLKSKFN